MIRVVRVIHLSAQYWCKFQRQKSVELTFVDVDVYEYIVVAMNCSHNTFHILTIQVCIEPSDIQGCSETSKKKKKKKIPQRPIGPLRGSSSPVDALSRRGWNPIKLAYKLAGWPAQLATSAFNQLSQYANSPGNRACCYAGLAVFFPSGSHNRR